MAFQSVRLALVLIAVAVGIAVAQNPSSGLSPAPQYIINSLKHFPHHVIIEAVPETGDASMCGGTILGEQWVVTSANCIGKAKRLQLHFQKLTLSDNSGYAAVVNRDAVFTYPSGFEDIALVKIPFKLVFSKVLNYLKPFQDDVSTLQNKMAVLPTFDTVGITNRLAYTLLNILPSGVCSEHNTNFDEYGQLCTMALGAKAAAVCPTNVGSGLIVGWPSNPTLVGIYTSSDNCQEGKPTIYTDISKYTSWMETVMA